MRELSSYHELCNSVLELSPVPGASSDTSSPRSSSTEDDLHERNCHNEQGACGSSKPIYNFSIPDFIKHERQPAAAAVNSVPPSQPAAVHENTDRPRESKRRHDQRDTVDNIHNNEPQQSSNRSHCRKNKRRRTDQTQNTHSPEFIDLTDVNDQEDTSSVRVLEDLSPYLDSSIVLEADSDPVNRHQQAASSFSYDSVADNLQDFRRRLRESRERINQIRREVTERQSRFLNRLSHMSTPCTEEQRIVSDGPAYSAQRDINHHPPEITPPYNFRNAEPPVITLDEDHEAATPNRDREVTRMILEDSLYSPPFLTPFSGRRGPSLETIEENIDRLEQRREQNLHHQMQERINQVRNHISRLDQQVSNNINRINESNSQRYPIHISDSPQESRHVEDEVEFLREFRPPQNTSTYSARPHEASATNYPNYAWGHSSRRRRFSNLLSRVNFGVPDFLFPYVHLISPPTPRLRHFTSTYMDEGEDYEALWSLAERLGPAKPRGLTRAEINRIHAFQYTASKASETNSTCVVCMSEYCYKEKIRKLPCTHDFHSKCIDKWLKSNKTCPVCRDEVKCT